MANNNSARADSDGNFSDWIEIHNPSDASINLIGWSLTDDANNLDKWQFPYLNIEPGGYQVVFASGKDRSYDSYRLTTDLHATPDGTFLIDLPEGTYDIRLTLGDTKRVRDNVEIQLQGERVDTVSTDAGEFVAKTYSADVTSATSSQLAIRLVDLGGVTSRAAIGAMIITSASGEQVGWFDFGKESSPLEPGFTQVTTSSIYSAGIGFGWQGSADFVVSAPDRGLTADQPHTNFKLSSRGEYVALVSPEGTIVSEHGPEGVSFPLQFPDVSYGVPNESTALLFDDASFSYLVPTAAEAALGTSWTERGFDDTSWTRTDSVGLSEGIGFANHTKFDGLFVTDVADVMQSVNGSLWIRQEFDIADPAAVAGLRLDVQFDDGLVAFLNGVEVARAIAPDALAWDSVATEGRLQDASVSRFFLGTGAGRLVAGTNVLAIQGLNRNAVDPDFLIRPQLLAVGPIDFTTAPVGFLDSPSPGSPNSLLRSATVTFDRENGLFDEPFLLGLSVATPGATIRYTTDGSVPTEESPIYNDAEPLAISATAFVQAIAFAPDFAPSTVSNAWFSKIDASLQAFSSNLPVVTLENFDTGEPASKVPNFQLHAFSLFEPDGETGRTTLTGTPTIETRAGIKVRGSSTASQPKRSFALEAWDERNEDTDIAPLGMPANSDWILYSPYTFDRALMRNPLAYELSNQVGRYAVRTRFVELYLNSDGGDLAAEDYRGVYVLMEKIKLGKDRVDITELSPGATTEPDVTGGWILKVDRNDQGDRGFSAGGQGFLHNDAQLLNYVDPKEDDVTSAQRAWISNFIDEMAASLHNPDPETGYPSYIDVDSWIDHHILNYLPMNVDGFRLSGYMFKDRDGKLEMGPVWDFDRSMESIDGRDDRPSVFEGPWDTSVFFSNDGRHPWWGQLFDNADFRQRWTDRWFELRKTVFSEENVTSIIDSMAAQLGEAQQRNFAQWPAVAPRAGAAYRSDRLDGTWQGEVEHMKAWLMERLAWTDAQFVDPPRATPDSGPLAAGAEIELSVDEGTIYYTIDGTDPRLPDGQINPSATVYNPTVTLVDANSDAQTLVPKNDTLAGWQSVGFDDSSWDSGRASIGFDAGSPTAPIDVPDGFTVREVHSIGQIVGLARADALLGGLNVSSETTVSGVPVINYLDGTVDHRFGSNLPMPAEGGNQIVIQATAAVVVGVEGTYTFGLNAVKGARLRIDGEDLIVSETSLGKDAFGTLALTAGTHELELTVFQDPKTTGLGDRNLSVELCVAPGPHDAFSDAFALLG
ncbi:MAG: CotH kinase family protein, partial [Pirellulales bacterium]